MEVDQERFQVGAVLHLIRYAIRKLSLVDAATMRALFAFREMFEHEHLDERHIKNLAAFLANWFDVGNVTKVL
jgi:hypothetical protein